jgi:copper chaperone CopZ
MKKIYALIGLKGENKPSVEKAKISCQSPKKDQEFYTKKEKYTSVVQKGVNKSGHKHGV